MPRVASTGNRADGLLDIRNKGIFCTTVLLNDELLANCFIGNCGMRSCRDQSSPSIELCLHGEHGVQLLKVHVLKQSFPAGDTALCRFSCVRVCFAHIYGD